MKTTRFLGIAAAVASLTTPMIFPQGLFVDTPKDAPASSEAVVREYFQIVVAEWNSYLECMGETPVQSAPQVVPYEPIVIFSLSITNEVKLGLDGKGVDNVGDVVTVKNKTHVNSLNWYRTGLLLSDAVFCHFCSLALGFLQPRRGCPSRDDEVGSQTSP